MVRFPSLVPRLYWFAVPVLICFFEILKESLPGLFDFLGSDNTKLYWKPCISKAWPQNYLRFGYLPGFGTQFGSLKPIFYSIPIIVYWLSSPTLLYSLHFCPSKTSCLALQDRQEALLSLLLDKVLLSQLTKFKSSWNSLHFYAFLFLIFLSSSPVLTLK